jgi:hypothetical protein
MAGLTLAPPALVQFPGERQGIEGQRKVSGASNC